MQSTYQEQTKCIANTLHEQLILSEILLINVENFRII
jgi:hypothetical protein